MKLSRLPLLLFFAAALWVARDPVRHATSPPSTPEPSPIPNLERFPRTEISRLLQTARDPDRLPWKPFRPGIDIHRLYGDGVSGPTAALLRFQPGATVPLHEHSGYEHLFILSGSQTDQNSTLVEGTLAINPPGTRHQVSSPTGCLVLAIYEKPVKFLNDHPTTR